MRYGQVAKIGTDGFANEISNGGFLKPRKPKSLNIGRSLVSFSATPTYRIPTDTEFLNLIMVGAFDAELAFPDKNSPQLYTCDRSLVGEIAETLDSGDERAIAVHSEIANGRTIALALLAEEASARGWQVFFAEELSEHAVPELRAVVEQPGKVLLLIDDYVAWLGQLEGLAALTSDQFAIVVSERSSAHDIAVDRLESVFSPFAFREYNLNALDEKELDWWVSILDTYGLWAELAGKSQEQKIRFLADNCGSQIQGILLKIFDSPVVRKRLEKAAKDIRSEPLVEKIAITTFVLTILNQRPTVSMLTDVWGVDAFERDSVQNNAGLANFIDISRFDVRVRSTAAAEYLLNHFWKADEVVSVLLEIAHAADRLYRVSIKYESLFKALMKFSSVQHALPEKGKRDAVVTYYESLKLIDRCKRYPLFWLQYAIGALVVGDLTRASKYFDTSYSLAQTKGWDTFQIDNHYARYLLVRAAEEAAYEEVMELFRHARTLINRQMKDDNLHYPYRVASTYQSVYDRFQSRFSEAELQEISQAARTVSERIETLPSDRARHHYVKKCKAAMKYIEESVTSRLG
jgi:hypothetical protein